MNVFIRNNPHNDLFNYSLQNHADCQPAMMVGEFGSLEILRIFECVKLVILKISDNTELIGKAIGVPNGNYWLNNFRTSNCAEKFLCFEITNNIVSNKVCSGMVEGVLKYDEYPACTAEHDCSVLCQSNQDTSG